MFFTFYLNSVARVVGMFLFVVMSNYTKIAREKRLRCVFVKKSRNTALPFLYILEMCTSVVSDREGKVVMKNIIFIKTSVN